MDFEKMDISLDVAAGLAGEYYGIRGTLKKLPGEVDFNFYLRDVSGEYTLKVTRPGTDLEYLKFQVAIIQHLTHHAFPLQIPEIIPALDESDFIPLENGRYLRLQKWVPGIMLDDIHPRTSGLLNSWGKTCGLFSQHLLGFDHPGAHRIQKWNPSEVLLAKEYQSYFQLPVELQIVEYYWNFFEQNTLPNLAHLRKSVNYNDAHEHNLLVNGDLMSPKITGIIDFGDALYTETINELAIACAYACMYMPDPLQAAVEVVNGYQSEFPLREDELSVLYSLISARLVRTVANAAWNKHNEPENAYLLVSEKPAWDLLKRWKEITPEFAEYRFRAACNLEPCPKHSVFMQWLEESKEEIDPVIDLQEKRVIPFDLSVGSLELGNNSNFANIRSFVKTIDRMLEEEAAEMAIGGYGEIRPFYATEAYQMEGNQGARWRTVHLGVDLWAVEDTAIYAPVDGEIFSLENNVGECNYGPTIILKHEPKSGFIFYSLYGHLSLDSIHIWKVGEKITKGQKLAAIGGPPINGNWPPHLHFQIILDLLDQKGDYPGVAYPQEIDTWLSICPDPNLFFKYRTPGIKSKSREEIFDSRNKRLGKSLSVSYLDPLYVVRGYMQHLYDDYGRRYLDTVNNVPHVGHQHPEVVKVAQKQIAVLNTNTRYLHENVVLLAEELLATLPSELCVVHFVNSGSEANELALRMVEACTGQKNIVAVEVGYHGNTNRCIEVSSYKFDGKGGRGAPSTTQIVPIPDPFRGIYRGADTGQKYASHVAQAIESFRASDQQIGGFICESILSCGGQIVLPEGYLNEAYKQIHAEGGLCIADEVQVGFGRVGDHFWGFELQGVIPDIVTMGKPIGNGHPLGAVVTTRKVADAFANGMEYFNTFGGNPVSCAIGREVLKIVKRDGLQDHAKLMGKYLTSCLKELQQLFPLIGDVRGHGLFIGVELVENRETLNPATMQASYLVNRMRERSILMSTDGPYNNVVKFKPPMCFNQRDADFLLQNLKMVLGENYLKTRGK